MASRNIDTQSDPGKQTVLNSIAEVSIFKEGIGVGILSLILDDVIIGVLRDGNGASVVRVRGFNSSDKLLVKEQLPDMRNVATGEGVVRQHMSICVGNDVNMGSATRVVTREQSLELSNTVRVGLLNTAQESLVQVGGIVAVAVHGALNSRVDTSGIAVPHIPVEVLDRLAGVDVNELAIENDRNSSLSIADIGTDQLSLHPEGTDLALGCQDTDGVLGEQLCFRCVRGNVEVGMVRGVHHLVGITGENGTLFVGVHEGGTTGLGTGVDSALLQLVRALIKRAACVVQEVSLRNMGVRVGLMGTGMGHGQAGQGKQGNFGVMHCFSGGNWGERCLSWLMILPRL